VHPYVLSPTREGLLTWTDTVREVIETKERGWR
jgi:hypothetical protein